MKDPPSSRVTVLSISSLLAHRRRLGNPRQVLILPRSFHPFANSSPRHRNLGERWTTLPACDSWNNSNANDGHAMDSFEAEFADHGHDNQNEHDQISMIACEHVERPCPGSRYATQISPATVEDGNIRSEDTSFLRLPQDAVIRVFAGYRWNHNSCFLDTSLELLYAVANLDQREFVSVLGTAQSNGGGALKTLAQCFELRRKLESDKNIGCLELSVEISHNRDTFRRLLLSVGAIQGTGTPESLWGWLSYVASNASKPSRDPKAKEIYNPACAYFDTLITEIHHCSGDKTTGEHLQIVSPAWRRWENQLSPGDHSTFGGRLSDWFRDFISIKSKFSTQTCGCFRLEQKQGQTCTGKRSDIRHIVLSMPVVLIIEFDLLSSSAPNAWNIPSELVLLTQAHPWPGASSDLTYDLVGLSLFQRPSKCTSFGHFIARFSSCDRTVVYNYDGLAHDGFVTEEVNGEFLTHVAGSEVPTPKGFDVHSAVFHLRGGAKAQIEFLKLRSQELREKLNLEIRNEEPFTSERPAPILVHPMYMELTQEKAAHKIRRGHREYIPSLGSQIGDAPKFSSIVNGEFKAL